MDLCARPTARSAARDPECKRPAIKHKVQRSLHRSGGNYTIIPSTFCPGWRAPIERPTHTSPHGRSLLIPPIEITHAGPLAPLLPRRRRHVITWKGYGSRRSGSGIVQYRSTAPVRPKCLNRRWQTTSPLILSNQVFGQIGNYTLGGLTIKPGAVPTQSGVGSGLPSSAGHLKAKISPQANRRRHNPPSPSCRHRQPSDR